VTPVSPHRGALQHRRPASGTTRALRGGARRRDSGGAGGRAGRRAAAAGRPARGGGRRERRCRLRAQVAPAEGLEPIKCLRQLVLGSAEDDAQVVGDAEGRPGQHEDVLLRQQGLGERDVIGAGVVQQRRVDAHHHVPAHADGRGPHRDVMVI